MAYNPGMAAENQFLRDSVVTLLDSLDTVGAAVEPSLFNKVRSVFSSYKESHNIQSARLWPTLI
jgi:hypothetical protein